MHGSRRWRTKHVKNVHLPINHKKFIQKHYINFKQKAAVHFERRLLILIKLLSPMVFFPAAYFKGSVNLFYQ